jgi:cell division septum initiation protein DivIVA
MAEKNFLSWLGFKDEENAAPSTSAPTGPATKGTSTPTGSNSTFERIRELEAELADLRARRDITSLTEEEFEILATETATSLIKTAQAREARAVAAAQRALTEAQQMAKQLTETAETKARTALASAESRGRKYIETAEFEAKEAIAKATKSAQDLIDSKQREASTITSAAKREADRVIAEATSDIANFKNWLNGAVEESERLQKIQHQAMLTAEEGIRQARSRLTTAFERLSTLGSSVDGALDANNRPKEKDFTQATPPAPEKSETSSKRESTASSTRPYVRAAAKPAAPTRKSVGRPPKRK